MAKQKKRLPSRKRAQNSPSFKMTERDAQILLAIHAYDGILSVDQIHRWFFPGKNNKRNAQRRLSLLFHNAYIRRPKQEELYRTPEPIVWLDKRGAKEVAFLLGEEYGDPGFKWRNNPRWSNIAHDILLNEFRHMLGLAAESHPQISIYGWLGQSELQGAFQEPVTYVNAQGKRQKKLVWPDGFCYLGRKDRQESLPLLVELDNGTMSNVRFGREKVSPNLHLMFTRMYRELTGAQGGRVLAVMAGKNDERYASIRKHVTEAGGARFFLFTRSEWLTVDNILTGDVWQLPHVDEFFSLEQYSTAEFQAYLKETAGNFPQSLFD